MELAKGTIEKKFSQLISDVKACNKCARMCNSERVLGPASGSLTAKVVFIGEAPGRLGADESQIPFHGDKSGHNFESLLEQVGLNRYELFVTNAVLCNPKDAKGNNATPTPTEIKNCAEFLQRQIELIDPKIVVTLGGTALKACGLVEEHELDLRTHVRTAHPWLNRMLIPAYHPGQRAMIHRSFANQLSDYQFIAELTRRTAKKTTKRTTARTSRGTRELIDQITARRPTLSYFALHKLAFLIEARAIDELGERLTDSYIIRQKDGPYWVELHPKKLESLGINLSIYNRAGSLVIQRQPKYELFENVDDKPSGSRFTKNELGIIDHVLEKYGSLPDAELKRITYTTSVMRRVLRKEKALGLNLFNAPLLVPDVYGADEEN
ncbi:uracil-DNA glycosylase family 4 [Paucimonas lemoignei]|uniref:Uracil-DNA glycosylase family 4 n=1 Tax=Paucimonas lemoignei TaxID=29443 RepID=A0A4R3I388_PAULE|nr:uracil-DNA glycosylase family protein [Paucimonas lemoignei]TCS38379.1 uracil-DNA glycosylase family 4 [Paucimonas lemoignei]